MPQQPNMFRQILSGQNAGPVDYRKLMQMATAGQQPSAGSPSAGSEVFVDQVFTEEGVARVMDVNDQTGETVRVVPLSSLPPGTKEGATVPLNEVR